MNKYDAGEIRALFDRGENIIGWVQSREGAANNSETAILYSYDVQAGSYLAAIKDEDFRTFKGNFGRHVARVLDEFAPSSLLEAGIGEGTSLTPVLKHMKTPPAHVLGFDISLSRLLYARRHISQEEQKVTLFTAALDCVPLATSSVDVVLTMHSIEPNHGREAAILGELLRVTRRRLVMIEPSYELASQAGRARMEKLGYVRDMPRILERLGYPAYRIEPWPMSSNPLNSSCLIVVNKSDQRASSLPEFVSPISKGPLVKREDCWFSPDDGHAFPLIANIPCLTTSSAVLASKLGEF